MNIVKTILSLSVMLFATFVNGSEIKFGEYVNLIKELNIDATLPSVIVFENNSLINTQGIFDSYEKSKLNQISEEQFQSFLMVSVDNSQQVGLGKLSAVIPRLKDMFDELIENKYKYKMLVIMPAFKELVVGTFSETYQKRKQMIEQLSQNNGKVKVVFLNIVR